MGVFRSYVRGGRRGRVKRVCQRILPAETAEQSHAGGDGGQILVSEMGGREGNDGLMDSGSPADVVLIHGRCYIHVRRAAELMVMVVVVCCAVCAAKKHSRRIWTGPRLSTTGGI